MGARAPLKRWVLEPPKIMGARAPLRNGCAPSFFKRALHELWFFHDSFYIHFAFIHLFSIQLFFKRWVLEPPKIMGARAPLRNGCAPSFFKRALHELYFFMIHFYYSFCIHSLVLCLVVLQIMSARAPLERWVLVPPRIMGARAP